MESGVKEKQKKKKKDTQNLEKSFQKMPDPGYEPGSSYMGRQCVTTRPSGRQFHPLKMCTIGSEPGPSISLLYNPADPSADEGNMWKGLVRLHAYYFNLVESDVICWLKTNRTRLQSEKWKRFHEVNPSDDESVLCFHTGGSGFNFRFHIMCFQEGN